MKNENNHKLGNKIKMLYWIKDTSCIVWGLITENVTKWIPHLCSNKIQWKTHQFKNISRSYS